MPDRTSQKPGASARGKIGLALGGGAARGWAHIGVLKALVEAGIQPDIIAGTSIGAVAGACYSAGRLDALEVFARSLTVRRVFGFLDVNLTGTGLINGTKLGDRLERELGPLAIEDLPQRYAAVATEIGTGHEVWLTRGSLIEAMRASYALPGIFKPVKIDGRWLFDGALVNPIPVSVCRALGARYVIAVNLNFDVCSRGTIVPDLNAGAASTLLHEAGPQAEQGKRGMTVRGLLQRQLFGQGREGDDTPGISTVMMDAFNIVQDRIARSRLAGDPPDAIISPRLNGINLFDFHKADALIEAGYQEASRVLQDVRRDLGIEAATSPQAKVIDEPLARSVAKPVDWAAE